MNPFRNRKPVLEPTAFYGREAELRMLSQYLAMQPPQCCAVMGLPRSGKTSLLYFLRQQAHLAPAARQVSFGAAERVLAVYVNVGPYIDLESFQQHGALYFWRDLYHALAQALPGPHALPPLAEPGQSDAAALDQVYTIRQSIATSIRDCPADMVLLLLDNAEGIARLPRPTGSLLRTLTQDPTLGERVAYVATSQVPLYQLYEPTTWQAPSSFWNLFTGPIYLDQLAPAAARALMLRGAPATTPEQFSAHEQAMLLRLAGRHPDLLTLACALCYDQRTSGTPYIDWPDLEQQLFEAALPLCQAIWQTLAHVPGAHQFLQRIVERQPVAPAEQHTLLPALARQGIVEHDNQTWRVSSAIMHRFILQQTAAPAASAPPPPAAPAPASPAFTHLEGAVYAFLRANAGIVCDREHIKRAVWETDPPSDSALQKLIERIRDKIEPDPKHPRRLLAVRGQGYILHPDEQALPTTDRILHAEP